jgi:hypothetical protein
VGVVYVTLGYYVAIINVMGGLVLKETLDVPIWSVDVNDNEIIVV